MLKNFYKNAIHICSIYFFNVILSQSDPVSFSSNIGSVARAGEVVNIEILASMEDQWHIYSVHKITEGPFPTEISISGDVIGSFGPIIEPEPKYVFDPGFDSETYYHEGDTKFSSFSSKRDLAARKVSDQY